MKTEYDFSKGNRGKFYRGDAKLSFPASDEKPNWTGPTGQIGEFIVEEAKKTLSAYREQPHYITEHANLEHVTAHGGYAHRQLFELVQNSADALLDAAKGKSILIRLTEGFLYCADDGNPIDERGIEGLMFAHMWNKRNTGAIGRFGLGFKSVLGVTDAPEFYSRPGSFRFDRTYAAEQIATVAQAERYPVLRLPDPIDSHGERNTDEELRELMSWATNIVRLPLKTGAHGDLAQQIQDFPPEFLLFVDHVRYLTLEDGERSRDFILQDRQGELHLDAGEGAARWWRFKTTHRLSANARRDQPSTGDSGDVPIWWATPLDRLTDPGQFWAFFPTKTASLVAGILNAPWKTNEDRQNLLPGPYNEELIETAAAMIAGALPKLATNDDPAQHLDALPRRHQGGDSEQADLLRKHLFSNLHEHEIVPDQDGKLRARKDISYPPKDLTPGGQIDTAPFERWAEYSGRPSNWLHHTALTRNRLATIDRLYYPEGEPPKWSPSGAPRADVAKWLQALVEGKEADEAIRASMAAIQTAAAIPSEIRSNKRLGDIVLTVSGDWRSPDPEHLFLPDDSLNGGGTEDPESCVHTKLMSDRDTLSALKELGLKPPSPESRFRLVAKLILRSGGSKEPGDDLHREFWITSRKLSAEAGHVIIQGHRLWPRKLRVRTQAGTWQPPYAVLLPGEITLDELSRDDDATVDVTFHSKDLKLLRNLDVRDAPRDERDLSLEPWFEKFWRGCCYDFTTRGLNRDPHWKLLSFETSIGCGPLEVLRHLSDEGRARYTETLLSIDAIYAPWTMRHKTQNQYPSLQCESPVVWMLRKHGRIRTPGGIVPLADALTSTSSGGQYPKSPEALHALLLHPKADKIKEVFNLAEPPPEIFGEDDPIPLVDVWPGLVDCLRAHQRACRLIRCERILVAGQEMECVYHSPDVYLSDAVGDDERRRLQLIAKELSLGLTSQQLEAILQRKTPKEIEERRGAIRQYPTDAERLLAAVGEQALCTGLPGSLLAVLQSDGVTLKGTDIADAAIATWHTDALKQYKWVLDGLDPPSQWAGSPRAVEFVRSLGFSAEWAGERDAKRDPFLEVEGPYSLPELHGYQRTIAENVRNMLRSEHGNGAERRGIISMPTGSGKTRVAVQAIVEAMRDDGFRGGVLWVADRDELCEQSVEAWRQVWSSIGTQSVRLRISRMWAGLERPQPTSELHVIVATIQTLNARLSNQPGEYEFLANFNLVVFDEAHRSIAPTFTSVMQDIGLTRFQRVDEPFMLGLTATPYRGRDKDETARLVRRYGSKRLDSGAFASDEPEAVIRQLQDMGVLAQAENETIEGETFPLDTILDDSLDKEELKRILDEWLALPWLPRSVEERIAQSAERTKRIVEAYETYIEPDWPTLIFATSVEHTQTVAALLNRRGIQSRSVSGATETATRRRVVEEFRRGEIKALVNHGVFREGFDAPKTRAIIVARPVYSPNLYFQMVGRGLRGTLNGGSDRCLILNVRDNIENFDRQLAFSELDWLWA